MRIALVLALALSAAAPAACGGDADEEVIRSWSRALNARDYERAGSFFEVGGVIEQGELEVRVPSRRAAILFVSGLPCAGDVTRVHDEGRTSLATFRLRRGPGGPCRGRARVRFRIREGKFLEWRQLPERPAPPGESA